MCEEIQGEKGKKFLIKKDMKKDKRFKREQQILKTKIVQCMDNVNSCRRNKTGGLNK